MFDDFLKRTDVLEVPRGRRGEGEDLGHVAGEVIRGRRDEAAAHEVEFAAVGAQDAASGLSDDEGACVKKRACITSR